MAGITSIVNPAKDSEVLLFSLSTKGFVHLTTKSTSDSKETGSTFGSLSTTEDGPMMKNSSLASLLQGKLVSLCLFCLGTLPYLTMSAHLSSA
jgi:hypothetical protein